MAYIYLSSQQKVEILSKAWNIFLIIEIRWTFITSQKRYREVLKLFNVEIRQLGRAYIVVVIDGLEKMIRYLIRLAKLKE